jgi:hypothetical protein
LRSIPWLLAVSSARPKSGPFPPPALPGFNGTMSLSDTPRRPGLSLAGVRLRGAPLTAGASRVALDLPVQTCCRHYPGGTAGGIGSFPWNLRQRPSPSLCWVGSHIPCFEAYSAFTHVTACLLAESPYATLCIRGFGSFVASTTAPIATGWNDSCRVGIAPTEDRRLGTAHKGDRVH